MSVFLFFVAVRFNVFNNANFFIALLYVSAFLTTQFFDLKILEKVVDNNGAKAYYLIIERARRKEAEMKWYSDYTVKGYDSYKELIEAIEEEIGRLHSDYADHIWKA